jgi:hypothetical protein
VSFIGLGIHLYNKKKSNEVIEAVELYLHPLISSPLDGGEFSASHSPANASPRNVICYPLSIRLGGPHSQYEPFGE